MDRKMLELRPQSIKKMEAKAHSVKAPVIWHVILALHQAQENS